MQFKELLNIYKKREDVLLRIKRDKELELSGEDFFKCCRVMAAFLEKNTDKGAHIGLLSRDGLDMAIFMFAVIASGRVAVPLNGDLNIRELEGCIEDSDVRYIFYDPNEDIPLEEISDRDLTIFLMTDAIKDIAQPSDTEDYDFPDTDETALSLLLFSSGTTGSSKIVMLTQESLTANSLTYTVRFPRRRVYVPFPSYHIAFVALLLMHLGQNDEICLRKGMKYFYSDIEYFKPEQIDLVPSMFNGITERAKRFAEFHDLLRDNLKRLWSVGAALSYAEDNIIINMGVTVLTSYGATEVSGVVVDISDHDPSSVGYIADFNEVRLSDAGEILVKGKNVMKGYYHDEGQTELVIKDGWFHTGDKGEIINNELFIKGRIKNTIILSNGENVNPEEIEAELNRSIWIDDAYVYEKKDRIYASVVNYQYLRESDEEKRSYIFEHIDEERKNYNKTVPTYRQVRKVKLRDSDFIKTPSGKIKRGKENEA